MATHHSYTSVSTSHKGLNLTNFLTRKHDPKATAYLLKRCHTQHNLLQQFSNKLWDKQEEKLRFFTPLHKRIVKRQKGILKIEEYKNEVRAADCPALSWPWEWPTAVAYDWAAKKALGCGDGSQWSQAPSSHPPAAQGMCSLTAFQGFAFSAFLHSLLNPCSNLPPTILPGKLNYRLYERKKHYLSFLGSSLPASAL